MPGPDALDLLRSLDSGVRPVGGAPRHDPGALDFYGLLRSARRGDLRSGRRVSLPLGVELTDEQQAELDRAADAAEALGLGRLFAVTDRVSMHVDVPAREVTDAQGLRESAPRHADLVIETDAAVVLPPSPMPDTPDDEAETVLAPRLRASEPNQFGNASLVRVLSQAGPSGE